MNRTKTLFVFASTLIYIKGAGSGIGEALCHVLLREGSKVAAVDINTISPDKYARAKVK